MVAVGIKRPLTLDPSPAPTGPLRGRGEGGRRPGEGTVHDPVLLAECIDGLMVRAGGRYIDATGGGGGYARALWRKSMPGGKLVVIDRDQNAIRRLERMFKEEGIDARCVHGNFRDIARLVPADMTKVDGVVADLGLSSDQLQDPERGFSFLNTGPLDMRMDESDSDSMTAAEIVNTWSETELADLFYRFADEHRSRRIARAVVRARPLTTTDELAQVLSHAYRAFYRGHSRRHPATRIFQALRMAVNDELGSLNTFLHAVPKVLAVGGRVAVVSFQSLEDREVKSAFKEAPWQRLNKKPIRPGDAEMKRNPRSRSAKLRIAELGGLS